ncbi:MAG TPA: hypothetical protein VGX78_14940 [Pirellulales bacterium]|nr:hypothetical protein [Pirellulales bacterium]
MICSHGAAEGVLGLAGAASPCPKCNGGTVRPQIYVRKPSIRVERIVGTDQHPQKRWS